MLAPLSSQMTKAEQLSRSRMDAIAFKGGAEFDEAKVRHDKLLGSINEDVARLSDGGRLIAIPHCPSACQPGPLADFLITLQIDPFSRTNMFYFASDLQTALFLDTCVYDRDADGRYDTDMINYYQSKMRFWEDFKKNEPNADVQFIVDVRDAILAEVTAEMAEIEATLHGDHRHEWRGYFGERVRQAA